VIASTTFLNFQATTFQKPTTTTSPVVTFETIYKNFFTLGLSGSDLTATKSSFKSLLTSSGMNVAQVDNYVAALQLYLKNVRANPTEAQKTVMTTQLDAFDIAEKNFIQSFPGLNNIEFDFGFGADLRNADFNGKRSQSSAAKTALRLNPAGTFAFFTGNNTVTNFAEYTLAAITVSKRIQSKA
jgi:hypothetical protein